MVCVVEVMWKFTSLTYFQLGFGGLWALIMMKLDAALEEQWLHYIYFTCRSNNSSYLRA